jgi:hypothetical protein
MGERQVQGLVASHNRNQASYPKPMAKWRALKGKAPYEVLREYMNAKKVSAEV